MRHRAGAIILLVSLAAWACAENMIRNPGFEEGADSPEQWSLGHEGRGDGSATWETEDPHSGKYCVRLEMKEDGDYWMARQTYPTGTVTPGKAYRISGWYRTEDECAHPCVYYMDKGDSFLGAWEVGLPPSEGRWKPFDFVFRARAGTDHFQVQLRAQGRKGVCWFDDVALEDADELVERGRQLVAPLLKIADENPEYLWVLVANGGRAEFEFVGSPSATMAWAVANAKQDDNAPNYGVAYGVWSSGRAIGASLIDKPTNTSLQTRTKEFQYPAQSHKIIGFSEGLGPAPVLLLGVKLDESTTGGLARVTASPVMKAVAGLEIPWQTRVLPASQERYQSIRATTRNDILRKAWGAKGDEARAAVCTAWANLTDEEWLERVIYRPGNEERLLVAADPRVAMGGAGRDSWWVSGNVATGARNEYLSAQVLYAPPGLPERVTAKVSELRTEDGSVIPTDACQVRMVEYVPFAGRWLPDPLIEEQPFTPSKHGPIVFWLTVHVPRDARPGEYEGTVSMQADDGPVTERNFKMRVRDYTLPEETHLQSSFWLFRGQINRYFGIEGDVAMEDYYPYIDLAASHRLAPIDTLEGPADPLFTVYREQDGSLSYDFSQWDKYLDRCKANGVNTIHLGSTHWMGRYFCEGKTTVLDRATGEKSTIDHKFLSKEHLDALCHYLRAAADHLKQRGEFDKCYIQPWDEPYGDGLRDSYEVLKGIKERVPDIPRLMDAQLPDAYDGKMAEVVNLWCPLSPQVEGGAFEPMLARGDTLWWYVCCAPRRPYANLFTNWTVAEMRALFWQTWEHQVTGVLYWGLNYWLGWGDPVPEAGVRFPKGPWVSSTTNVEADYMGDGYFIYPGETADTPLSSIRLETIRDGIEDYETLYLLDKLVKANPGADDETIRLARQVLGVRSHVSESLREFDREGYMIDLERQVIADLIEKLQ